MSAVQTIHRYRVTYAKKTALAQQGHNHKPQTLRIRARDEYEAKNNAAHSLGDDYEVLTAERIDTAVTVPSTI